MADRIGVDFARLDVLHNRVGEIISKLQTTMQTGQEILSTISNGIQNDGLTSVLKMYGDNSVEQSKTIIENLRKLDEFLVEQLGDYERTEAEAAEELATVDSILSQIA